MGHSKKKCNIIIFIVKNAHQLFTVNVSGYVLNFGSKTQRKTNLQFTYNDIISGNCDSNKVDQNKVFTIKMYYIFSLKSPKYYTYKKSYLGLLSYI